MKHAVATLVFLIAACGGKTHKHRATSSGGADEQGPRTHDAAARAKAEAEASPDDPVSGQGKHWGGWRYQGSRDDCFFVVGRRCFADEARACAAAKCKSGECELEGGGPATVVCKD
ncbi:MAG TPA: hypothetical protein VL463_00580 [Kofleriaceae bacterium]|nr:hypothetical protein [Kofleriaceae bacterium]